MSIPYYDDLYSFPGGYPWQWRSHKHHPEHGLHPSYVTETSKKVDILDKFGNLRYNITLSSQVFYDTRCYKTIVSQTLPEGLVAFLEVPENGWQDNYNEALEDFRGCVDKYRSLINAEMQDFRDIEVYQDKIDYKVQKPRCCDSCKWCMKTIEGQEHPHFNYQWHKPYGKVVKRQCCSPDNEQVFNYTKQYPQLPHYHGHTSWQKLPWQKPQDASYGKPEWDPRRFPRIIFPTVDAMGICENYMSGECDYNTFKERENPVRRLAETIAPAYTVSVSCVPGDLVYYCGKLYECISSHPGGRWDKDHFKPTTVEDELQKKTTSADVSSMISSALTDYATYDEVSSIVSNAVSSQLSSYAARDEVSSMISDTLVDYTTYDNVEQIVEGYLVGYATQDDISAFTTSSDVKRIVRNETSSYAKFSDLSSFVTSCDVRSIVDSSMSGYATQSDISAFITSSDVSGIVSGVVSSVMSGYVTPDALSDALQGYIPTNALCSYEMPDTPTQRQIADVVKAQLEVMGGKVI